MKHFNLSHVAKLLIGSLLVTIVSIASMQSFARDSNELMSLSLKELMNIPFAEAEKKQRIYQPKNNKIGNDSINFAILSPISSYPLYGTQIVAAADLAAEYINQQGGIGGKRLVMLRGDDEENTPVSAQIAKDLIDNYQVEALIGPATSDSVANILEDVSVPRNIPLITQAASSTQLRRIAGNKNFFQMVADNNKQVKLMMSYLHDQQGYKNFYIIAGRDLYSREIIDGVTRFVASHPGSQVNHIKISKLVYLEGMDLSSEISRIQKSGSRAIIITLPTSQMITMLRKLEQAWRGPFPIIMAADTIKPIDLINAEFKKANECIYTYVSSPDALSPELKHQINALLESKVTGFDSAYVYDATIILAMAKKLSMSLGLSMDKAIKAIAADGYAVTRDDYKNIVSLFKSHKKLSFNGYSGRVQFDQAGDNIAASMKIYPLIKDDMARQNCLQPANKLP